MTWRERVVAAEARGKFTHEDFKLASVWDTCAVGEQHQRNSHVVVYIPTDCFCHEFRECPQDDKIARLGGIDGFFGAVILNDMHAAGRYLDKIEDRVMELKRAL